MSAPPPGTGEDPLQVLLDRVERDREERCREILEAARSEADRIRAQAYAEGRQRLHRTVTEERRRVQERLRSARAERETRERRQRHRQVNAALERAWQLLEGALEDRWADPRGREEWVRGALEQAERFLPPGTWTLEHPEGLDPETLPEALAVPERITLETRADPGLAAGIRIRCGAAEVDASPSGLLADRERIRSRLLAAIEEQRAREEGE